MSKEQPKTLSFQIEGYNLKCRPHELESRGVAYEGVNISFVNPLRIIPFVQQQHIVIEPLKDELRNRGISADYIRIVIPGFETVFILLNSNLGKEAVQTGSPTTPVADVLADLVPVFPDNNEGVITFASAEGERWKEKHVYQRNRWGIPLMQKQFSSPNLATKELGIEYASRLEIVNNDAGWVSLDPMVDELVRLYLISALLDMDIDENNAEIAEKLQYRSELMLEMVKLPLPILLQKTVEIFLYGNKKRRIKTLGEYQEEVFSYFETLFADYLTGKYEDKGKYLDHILKLSAEEFGNLSGEDNDLDKRKRALEGAMNMLSNLIFAGLDTTRGLIKGIFIQILRNKDILEDIKEEVSGVDLLELDYFQLLTEQERFPSLRKAITAATVVNTSTPRIARRFYLDGVEALCLIDLQEIGTRGILGEVMPNNTEDHFRAVYDELPDNVKMLAQSGVGFGFLKNPFSCVGINIAIMEVLVFLLPIFKRLQEEDLVIELDESKSHISPKATREQIGAKIRLIA